MIKLSEWKIIKAARDKKFGVKGWEVYKSVIPGEHMMFVREKGSRRADKEALRLGSRESVPMTPAVYQAYMKSIIHKDESKMEIDPERAEAERE